MSVNRGTSSSGEKVTITIKPDTGYTVDTVTVSGSANRSVSVTKVDDSTYTYIQPGMDVKINVTFRAVANTAWAGCSKNSSCPISRFTDADAKAWYHDGVHWALENSVMNGVGDNKFNPNGETSRAMVVTMLWRLEGSPAYVGQSEYTDVSNEDWYGQAVRWADAEGIVNVPLASVTDKALFINVPKEGAPTVQLIAIRDGSGLARIAFNTCQACSPSPRAWFAQRDDGRLVCQNCGNDFGPEAVGASTHGCNPAPIPGVRETANAFLVPATALDAARPAFANWAGPRK